MSFALSLSYHNIKSFPLMKIKFKPLSIMESSLHLCNKTSPQNHYIFTTLLCHVFSFYHTFVPISTVVICPVLYCPYLQSPYPASQSNPRALLLGSLPTLFWGSPFCDISHGLQFLSCSNYGCVIIIKIIIMIITRDARASHTGTCWKNL